MAVIAVCSQKGGVGKTTVSRALLVEAVGAGLSAKLADLDTLQSTATDWYRIRLAQGVAPDVEVQAYGTLAAALRNASALDYLILDGAARSTTITLEMARRSDLVVLPSGCSSDDLRPAVRLANELEVGGVPRERIVFALCRVGTPGEERDARAYILKAGFSSVEGSLPERAAYRTAQNAGRAVTEVSILSLRRTAETFVSSIGRLLE